MRPSRPRLSDNVDDLLATASFPVSRRCLGLTLRPFSLWHAHGLEGLGNCFGLHCRVSAATILRHYSLAEVYREARVAAGILSNGFDPDLRALRPLGHRLRERLRARRWARHIPREADTLMEHREAALALPVVGETKGRLRESPTWLALYADLRQYLHMGHVEAWETPVPLARWLLLVAAEGRGLETRMIGPAGRALIDEVRRRQAEMGKGGTADG